jgi:hypothetical protein
MEAPGEELLLDVLGAGRVRAVIEAVEEVRPMGGLPGLARRLTVRLPDGSRTQAMVFGDAAPAFLDPRYRQADDHGGDPPGSGGAPP